MEQEDKETVYRLVDEFSVFYWAWMAGAASDVRWMQNGNWQTVRQLVRYTFENLCFKHLDQIKRSLGISGIQTSAGTWAVSIRRRW